MNYKHVIWDWNGTLLNDVKFNHSLLNYLQEIEGVKQSSLEEYRKMFTFPIINMYKEAGLIKDDKSFDRLADIYIKKFEEEINTCPLQDDVVETLDELLNNGISNSILTASQEDMALNQIEYYNIEKYFIALTGKKDFYASGKSELIDKHIKKIGYDPEDIIFVGDTLHDMEIANEIGCDYILVLNGHQDLERFINKNKDLNVADNLKEVCLLILGKI